MVRFAHHAAALAVHHRAGRRAVPQGDRHATTASISASTAGPRWPSTSTRTRSCWSPSRASTGSTGRSTTATRSTSTTSCSCRSSTPARWRTRPASRSWTTTSSAPRSPTTRYERRADTILHEMAHMWFGDLVTMRWWDDLWLNESFASFVSVLARPSATRFTVGLDDVRQRREDLGVPAGPAVLDAPDRGRHPRRAGGRGQLRRDHVRQGRQRAQAAGRVRGDRAVPAGDAGLLPPVRVRQHHAGRPARRAGARSPAATCRSGRSSGWRPPGVNTLRAGVRAGRGRALHVVRDRAGRRPSRAAARCATTGWRSGSTGPRAPSWSASSGSSWTSPASGPRCRSWSASPSRTCCWSTTTT